MNWILSFFSSEAHVAYIINQLTSIRSSIEKAETSIANSINRAESEFAEEKAALEHDFDVLSSDLRMRKETVQKAKSALSSFL